MVPILGCFGLAFLMVYARAIQGSWLAPGSLFAGYWLVATIGPFLFLRGAEVSAHAMVYVMCAVLAFVAGALLATMRGSGVTGVHNVAVPRGWPVMALIRLGTVCGLAAAALAVLSSGFQIGQVFSLQGLLDVGNANAVNRYTGLGEGDPITAALLGFAYAASVAAPFARLLDRPVRLWVVLQPLLATAIYSTVTTARLPLLLAASMTASGLLVVPLLRNGKFQVRTGRRLLMALLGAGLIGAAFIAIAFVRLGVYDDSASGKVESKISVYAFGYLPAFSTWLDRYELAGGQASLGYGSSSLAGVSLISGQDRDLTRAYDERVTVTPGAREMTNIYTGFRNLLLDFGEVGGAIVLTAWGFVTERARRAAKRGSALGAGLMATSYTVMAWTNTMIITTFSNVAIGFALAIMLIGFVFRSHGAPAYEAGGVPCGGNVGLIGSAVRSERHGR